MEGVAEVVVSVLIVVGASAALMGSWALARFPSLMTRLHGPSKATTLGVGGCLVASLVYFPVFGGRYSMHELLITLFLFLTAPVSAHMIAKAHLHCQGPRLDPNPADGVRESIPPTGTEADWATFQEPEKRPSFSPPSAR